MKTVRVILSPEAEEVYKYLNEHAMYSKHEQTFLNAVNKGKYALWQSSGEKTDS
jgi:hypothetical protein